MGQWKRTKFKKSRNTTAAALSKILTATVRVIVVVTPKVSHNPPIRSKRQRA